MNVTPCFFVILIEKLRELFDQMANMICELQYFGNMLPEGI